MNNTVPSLRSVSGSCVKFLWKTHLLMYTYPCATYRIKAPFFDLLLLLVLPHSTYQHPTFCMSPFESLIPTFLKSMLGERQRMCLLLTSNKGAYLGGTP